MNLETPNATSRSILIISISTAYGFPYTLRYHRHKIGIAPSSPPEPDKETRKKATKVEKKDNELDITYLGKLLLSTERYGSIELEC